jgi:V/A-type H+-transporting ATPase subunit D
LSDVTPTRSFVLLQKDERRAMHEGYVFLDEKCLLLAGEMLRELIHHAGLQREFVDAWQVATAALQAAVGRHGLEGLQVYPAADLAAASVRRMPRTLMGVTLQDAVLVAPAAWAPSALDRSPEAEACRRAFRILVDRAAPLAAVAGNLERLNVEYRRAVRRARALQDVLLPEIDRDIGEMETRLEELEQEDALGMRAGVTSRPAHG